MSSRRLLLLLLVCLLGDLSFSLVDSLLTASLALSGTFIAVCLGEGEGLIVSPSSNSVSDDLYCLDDFKDLRKEFDFELVWLLDSFVGFF